MSDLSHAATTPAPNQATLPGYGTYYRLHHDPHSQVPVHKLVPLSKDASGTPFVAKAPTAVSLFGKQYHVYDVYFNDKGKQECCDSYVVEDSYILGALVSSGSKWSNMYCHSIEQGFNNYEKITAEHIAFADLKGKISLDYCKLADKNALLKAQLLLDVRKTIDGNIARCAPKESDSEKQAKEKAQDKLDWEGKKALSDEDLFEFVRSTAQDAIASDPADGGKSKKAGSKVFYPTLLRQTPDGVSYNASDRLNGAMAMGARMFCMGSPVGLELSLFMNHLKPGSRFIFAEVQKFIKGDSDAWGLPGNLTEMTAEAKIGMLLAQKEKIDPFLDSLPAALDSFLAAKEDATGQEFKRILIDDFPRVHKFGYAASAAAMAQLENFMPKNAFKLINSEFTKHGAEFSFHPARHTYGPDVHKIVKLEALLGLEELTAELIEASPTVERATRRERGDAEDPPAAKRSAS